MGGQGASQQSNAVWLYTPDAVQGDFTTTVNCFTVDFTNQSTTGCNHIKETSWDFGDGSTAIQDNPTHVYAMNGVYQVTMIVKNCSWDADTIVQSVTIDCGFSISLPSDTICVGECANLVVNSSENPDSVTFVWDNGIVVNNDSVTVCPLVTTSYTVIATSATGDVDTTTATVTVFNPPLVDLGSDTVVCGGTLLLDAGNAPALYQWQDNSSNQQFMVSSSGTYSVTVDNGGCSDSDTIQVTINGPVVNLGPDTTVCIPQFSLNAGNPGSTYVWQDGSTAQIYQLTAVGTYYVTVTDANGCQSTDTIHVSPGSLPVNLGPDAVLCVGGTLSLDAGNAGATYNWSTGATTQQVIVNTAGSYFVDVTFGICQGSDTLNLVLSDPLAVFSVSDTIGCAPLEVVFTDLSTSSSVINGWSWSFGDGTFSNAQNPTHSYSQSGNYNVQLSISTVDGCISDTSKIVTVTVIPQPLASFVFSPQTPELETEISFIDQSVNATSWSWNFGDGAGATIQNPTHTYMNVNDFEVILIVTNDVCTDTAEAFIVIEEGLLFYVPNAFTPDNDEFNQVFKPVITSGVDLTSYHLTIYDRWGEIVFESKNTEVGWDGSYARCGIVQDGTYTWKIEFKGKRNSKAYVYHGHVTVLK
jgi:gliding motility-associated-like protein